MLALHWKILGASPNVFTTTFAVVFSTTEVRDKSNPLSALLVIYAVIQKIGKEVNDKTLLVEDDVSMVQYSVESEVEP
jgi:hypothetical protein